MKNEKNGKFSDVRSEIISLNKSFKEMVRAINETIANSLSRKLLAGRSLTDVEVDDLSLRVQKILTTYGNVYQMSCRRTKADQAYPGNAVEILYCTPTPNSIPEMGDSELQLTALRVLITRDQVEFEVMKKPVFFGEHAVRRLCERSHRGAARKAIQRLFRTCLDNVAFFHWGSQIMRDYSAHPSFTLPMSTGSGAVVGHIPSAWSCEQNSSGFVLVANHDGSHRHTINGDPLFGGSGKTSGANVRTFFHKKYIDSERQQVLDLVKGWIRDNKEAVRLMGRGIVWPNADLHDHLDNHYSEEELALHFSRADSSLFYLLRAIGESQPEVRSSHQRDFSVGNQARL